MSYVVVADIIPAEAAEIRRLNTAPVLVFWLVISARLWMTKPGMASVTNSTFLQMTISVNGGNDDPGSCSAPLATLCASTLKWRVASDEWRGGAREVMRVRVR
jgi:hypothetical protein